MLPIAFFGQNLHFTLNLLFSLVLFASFWLYFDSWLLKKGFRACLKWLGFLVLSLAFLLASTNIETSILGSSIFGVFSENLVGAVKLLGYFLLIVSLLSEPLQPKPPLEGIVLDKGKKSFSFLLTGWLPAQLFLPFGALVISLLYLRRATIGLERHLKSIALAFFLLSISEAFGLARLLRSSPNIDVSNLSAAFGPLWILEQVFLFLATLVLGKWVWSYLVKRIQSQLFMIFTSSVLIIFLIVSVSFTFLLINNIQKDSLSSLVTAAKVLNLNLDSKRAELAANAQVFSQNPEVVKAVKEKDHKALNAILEDSLAERKISTLALIAQSGMVLARAEDPQNWGDSLDSDPAVEKGLAGSSVSNIVSKNDVLSKALFLEAAEPIKDGSKVVGTVLVSLKIDNSFLDGVKGSTGLDGSVYVGDERAATTLVGADGKERVVGVKQTDQEVKDTVLKKAQSFQGRLTILNRPFLAVYAPIKNINNEVIGMAFTGEPQVLILRDSGKSIQLIFLLSAILLVVSILPAYLIANYISKQVR